MSAVGAYCTVVYDGSKAGAAHLAKAFTLKGREFATGAEVEVPATLAGLALKAAPAGSMKVIKGEPVDEPVVSGTVKGLAKKAAAMSLDLQADPAAALAAVPKLDKDTVAVLGKADAEVVAHIDSGKADAGLAIVAMVAKALGRETVAKAAARRAGALQPKG